MQFENLNGQQRAVLTYTLAPDVDPDTLIEDSIEYDGFRYTWAYTTKEEHPYQEVKTVTQTVTVETAKKDLNVVLAELAPTIAYDDGTYTGTLALDHTTLSAEAAGYANRSSTVTETKVIGGLDRNDMSYIPATTVKNGKTLSLSNVEWQVTATALVGEALVPCQYQAVATYSGSSSYQVATGYVTTADYVGEVVSSGIKDVTYTVVYTGTEIIPPAPRTPAIWCGLLPAWQSSGYHSFCRRPAADCFSGDAGSADPPEECQYLCPRRGSAMTISSLTGRR